MSLLSLAIQELADTMEMHASAYVIYAWNEEDHPRDAHGKFATKGGTAAVNTPDKAAARLANLGYRLDEAKQSSDVWRDQRGRTVRVSKYDAQHPGNVNLRRYRMFGPDGERLYQGHQLPELERLHGKQPPAPPQAPAAPAKQVVAPAPKAPAPAAPAQNALAKQAAAVVSLAMQKKLADAGFALKGMVDPAQVMGGRAVVAFVHPSGAELRISTNAEGKTIYQISIGRDEQGKLRLAPAQLHRPFGADGQLRPDIQWALSKPPAGLTQAPVKRGDAPPEGTLHERAHNALIAAGFVYKGTLNKRAYYALPDKNVFVLASDRRDDSVYKDGKNITYAALDQGMFLFRRNKQGNTYLPNTFRDAVGLPRNPVGVIDEQKGYELAFPRAEDRAALDKAGFTVTKAESDEAGNVSIVLTHPSGVRIEKGASMYARVFDKDGKDMGQITGVRDQFGYLYKGIRQAIGMPDPDLRMPTAKPADETEPEWRYERGAHSVLVGAGIQYMGMGRDKDGNTYASYKAPNGTRLQMFADRGAVAFDKDGNQVGRWLNGAAIYGSNRQGNYYLRPEFRTAMGLPKPQFTGDAQAEFNRLVDREDQKALADAGFKLDRVELNDKEEPYAMLTHPSGVTMRYNGNDYILEKGGQPIAGPNRHLADNFGFVNKDIRQAIGMPDPDLRIPTAKPPSAADEPPYELIGSIRMKQAMLSNGFVYQGVGRDKDGWQYAKYTGPNGVTLRATASPDNGYKAKGYDKDGNLLGEWGKVYDRNRFNNGYLIPEVRKALGVPLPAYRGGMVPDAVLRTLINSDARNALIGAGFVVSHVTMNDKEEPTVVLTHPNGVQMIIDGDGYKLQHGSQAGPRDGMGMMLDKFGFLNKEIRQAAGLPEPDLKLPTQIVRSMPNVISGGLKDALKNAGFVLQGVGRDKDGVDYAKFLHPTGAVVRIDENKNIYVTPPGGKEVQFPDQHPYERDAKNIPNLKIGLREAAGMPTWWLSAPGTSDIPQPVIPPRVPAPVVPSESVQPDLPIPDLPPRDPSIAIEKALSTGQSTGNKNARGGINALYKINVAGVGECGFKPNNGEDTRCAQCWAVEGDAGAQAKREVAAWQIAKMVGMRDLMAPRAMREHDGELGVVFPWTPGEVAGNVSASKRFDGEQDCARCAAYDYVVADGDRHSNNWLIQDDASEPKIQLIDHGLIIPNDDKMNSTQGFLAEMMDAQEPGLRPYEMAQPFVDKKNDIITYLANQGFSKEAIHGVAVRIDDLARAKQWNDLKYKAW